MREILKEQGETLETILQAKLEEEANITIDFGKGSSSFRLEFNGEFQFDEDNEEYYVDSQNGFFSFIVDEKTKFSVSKSGVKIDIGSGLLIDLD